jgi:thiol:disulfide interchange protein DsbD
MEHPAPKKARRTETPMTGSLGRMAGSMAAALAGLLLLAAPLAAAPVKTENATAELVADAAQIAPGEPFHVALKLTPREHWHTYWRNPGDSGLATSLEWTLPQGFVAGDIDWPAPRALPFGPLTN